MDKIRKKGDLVLTKGDSVLFLKYLLFIISP